LFALVLIILAVGIIVPFSIGYILAVSSNAPVEFTKFTLIANGTAFDEINEKDIGVSLSFTGTADGKLEDIVNVNILGGDINVEGYESVSIADGSGTLIKSGETVIELDLVEQYGGNNVTWMLSCETSEIDEETLSVLLNADNVSLPFINNPTLSGLSLTGTVTFE
jgi:hypothetical protein